jgi:hypothetical protein
MERPDPPGDLEPEEQHVHETSAAELAAQEALADVQADAPAPAGDARRDLPGLGPNTGADLGGAGGGTTADPGRQNPIVPGEGRI